MTTQTFPILTVNFIKENIGKEITWHAYGDRHNFPMKGICRILGLKEDGNKVRPEIVHIKGDDLSFGWVEDNYITYSDGSRPVLIGSAFDIFNVKWDIEGQGMLRINGTPMTYGIVVYNGEDVNEKARKATTATEFDIEHIV